MPAGPQRATASRRDSGRRPRSAPHRSGGGRLARTIVLGAVAVAFAIYWLAAELGLDRDELLGYAAVSVLFVGVLVVLGLVLGVLVWLARRAAERRRNPNSDSFS